MNSPRFLQNALESFEPEVCELFYKNLEMSSSAVVFGSFAVGCETRNSDLDVLFIGHGKNEKRKRYDFVWIQPHKTSLRSWLGSELANHIAHYGVCIKGDFNWKNHVFISKEAILKKQQLIFNRLLQIYTFRYKTSYYTKIHHISRSIIDLFRLVKLTAGLPVPPTLILINEFCYLNGSGIRDLLVKPNLLGRLGATFLEEIFESYAGEQVYEDIARLLFRHPL